MRVDVVGSVLEENLFFGEARQHSLLSFLFFFVSFLLRGTIAAWAPPSGTGAAAIWIPPVFRQAPPPVLIATTWRKVGCTSRSSKTSWASLRKCFSEWFTFRHQTLKAEDNLAKWVQFIKPVSLNFSDHVFSWSKKNITIIVNVNAPFYCDNIQFLSPQVLFSCRNLFWIVSATALMSDPSTTTLNITKIHIWR